MHFEIILDSEEVEILISKLKLCYYLTIDFFCWFAIKFDQRYAANVDYIIEEANAF